MHDPFQILIADRNPHVSRLIRRELSAAGCRVREAEGGVDALRLIYESDTIDLLILDPDLPDVDPTHLLRRLRNRIPFLPVVIHAFASDVDDHPEYLETAAFVEKRGNSIERLREAVFGVLDGGTVADAEAS